MDSKKTGTFIAALRKEKGLTQSALAEKLNISNRTISKWETGDGMPDISILLDLASNLGVTVDELLNGEKSETAEIRVTEIENRDNTKNTFLIAFIISLFLGVFGAVLSTVTEAYNIWAFDILFYNHWEIMFCAVSLFSVAASALSFAIGVVKLKLSFSQDEILKIAGKKGLCLFTIILFMPLSFSLRIIDVTLRRYDLVVIISLILLIALVILFIYLWKKIDKRIK